MSAKHAVFCCIVQERHDVSVDFWCNLKWKSNEEKVCPAL